MGEKSGGLWLIVIVIFLSGLLMVSLSYFYEDSFNIINVKFMDTLNEFTKNLGDFVGNM